MIKPEAFCTVRGMEKKSSLPGGRETWGLWDDHADFGITRCNININPYPAHTVSSAPSVISPVSRGAITSARNAVTCSGQQPI